MVRTREEPTIKNDPESITRKTVDGHEAIITGKNRIKFLEGKALCTGGIAFGCFYKELHPVRLPTTYDDHSRNLRGIHIEKADARAAYWCRKCKAYMGCGGCIADGDLAGIVCTNCHDWANDISEQVHGRMTYNDVELRRHGLKLVIMRGEGKIDGDDFDKLWAQALKTIVKDVPPASATDSYSPSVEQSPEAKKTEAERRRKLEEQAELLK